MSELTSDGYQSLREHVVSSNADPNDWDYIEIYDDSGSAVTRVSITGDSRAEWRDLDGDNVLEVFFQVTGADSDITQPVTLNYSAVWDAASSGRQISQKEQFAQATINQDGDTVDITHTIYLPQN